MTRPVIYTLPLTSFEGDWRALGETIVRAHAALRERLLFDRIRMGFTALVESR